MERKQINIRVDPETNRKLNFCIDHGYSISDLFKSAVVAKYAELTDTVRIPVIGKISNGCVFVSDAGKEYIGSDTERE